MAHHQHHGLHHAAHSIQSPEIQQVSSSTSHTLDEETAAELDEPPDGQNAAAFRKTSIPQSMGKQSLLTRALNTDTDSYDDEETDHVSNGPHTFIRQTSRSSTCSTFSGRSGFTSDEGLTSGGTRSSTPNSPPRPVHFAKPDYVSFNSIENYSDIKVEHANLSQSPKHVSASGSSEPAVEAELGRKRCITFSCGQQNAKPSTQLPQESKNQTESTQAPKRQSTIKFSCPSKMFCKKPENEDKPQLTRHLSPPPPKRLESPSPSHTPDRRPHRDSDTTIKYESPKLPRKAATLGRVDSATDDSRSEAVRFHEFASSDEDVEDWIQESTCHKSKLTIEDTLVKEKVIQQLGEEAEEEALEEEEDVEGDLDDDLDDEISEGGFQTDDEEGFAESDDDDDGDSDYEWWAPKRSSPEAATMLPNDNKRHQLSRTGSDSSVNSALSRVALRSSKSPAPAVRRKSRAIPIRPATPELPDSTDFVCGTLDEDRPLEEAYASCIEQRKAAKHRSTPQDIDPTFPTSDPDLDTDEEDDDDLVKPTGKDGNDEEDTDEGPRGRKATPKPQHSPRTSPKRLKSPAPMSKTKITKHHSPAPPHPLFSPSARHIGPNQATPLRLRSPRPSRHTSPSGDRSFPIPTQRYLAQRPQLTHTTSLPRSPNPITRGMQPSKGLKDVENAIESSDEEYHDATTHQNPFGYSRGAIDIVQGLERKRLRRRQVFMEKYHRKGEKKRERGENRRPQPGKGAERMRQVGIECAFYRGKRVLSI